MNIDKIEKKISYIKNKELHNDIIELIKHTRNLEEKFSEMKLILIQIEMRAESELAILRKSINKIIE